MRRSLSTLIALVLLIAACGDGDGGIAGSADPETEAAVQSLRVRLQEPAAAASDDDPLAMNDGEALCAAESLVETLGAEWVVENADQEFEVAMSSATFEQRRSVVDAILTCVDAESAFTTMFSADGSVSTDSSRCVAQAMLGSDEFLDAVAESLTGAEFDIDSSPGVMEALLPAFFECLSAEEMANLGG